LYLQAAQNSGNRTNRLCRLSENVVRQQVGGHRAAVGDVERAITDRAPHLETSCSIGDAATLRGNFDPGVSISQNEVLLLKPLDGSIVTIGHVLPLDYRRAIELGRISRPIDDNTGATRALLG